MVETRETPPHKQREMFSQVQEVSPCTFVNILRIISARGHSDFKLFHIFPGFQGVSVYDKITGN